MATKTTTTRVQAVQGLRSSNAATAIPSRKVRKGNTRADARRRAISDYR